MGESRDMTEDFKNISEADSEDFVMLDHSNLC
jgi:hypothetical protein